MLAELPCRLLGPLIVMQFGETWPLAPHWGEMWLLVGSVRNRLLIELCSNFCM